MYKHPGNGAVKMRERLDGDIAKTRERPDGSTPVLPLVPVPGDAECLEAISHGLASRREELGAALAALAVGAPTLARIADLLVRTLRAGGKVLVAGNGGSAAEAQHFAAELVGRFKRERAPYACLSLTTDTSALTAIANDYGYQHVFARQVEALGAPGDVLIAFSTSGESENLVRAFAACRRRGLVAVAVTGSRPNRLERAADLAVRAPTADTALAQELHMSISHLLCEVVEARLATTEHEVAEAGLAATEYEAAAARLTDVGHESAGLQ